MNNFIKDVKSKTNKQRSQTGVVDFKLSEEQSLKAVGVIYGIEHSIKEEGFEALLFLDKYNQRIKILNYNATNFDALILKIRWIAEANSLDKIICMSPRHDWENFLRHGYVLEAVLKYYLNGEDAFIMSKFRSQERLTSSSLMDEILMIEKIMSSSGDHPHKQLEKNFKVRLATKPDIPQLIELYSQIFPSYPSPLIHEDYFNSIFQKDSIFSVCVYEDNIVAAASAELNKSHMAAELTDCATTPEARGIGIMTHLLKFLENELRSRKYLCAYTMARARSFGMNNVFFRLNYEFLGRLINNCDIYGAFEDMNIWTKDLRIEE